MPRKNDPKGTIEKIIYVSAELFSEKGYDKTSMQDIVDALGMSKGAVFHHFKSKEEIFHAVVDRQSAYIEQRVQAWIAEMEGLTAREKLIGMLEKNLNDQQAHALDNVLSTQMQSPRFVLANMQETLHKGAPIFANIMREGKEDGTISTDFPDECAEVFLLLLNIWCDPTVFACDVPRLTMRFRFLQQLMANMGVDIISDDLLSRCVALMRKLYNESGE